MNFIFSFLILLFSVTSCKNTNQTESVSQQSLSVNHQPTVSDEVIVGAAQFDAYLPYLSGKRVGMVVNQTSVVEGEHLVDLLLKKNVDVIKVFPPEHGFRGSADAGEKVEDGVDKRTGVPIVSIYGKNKKPTSAQLADVDIVIFDIQDVGARFYTYISTLEYVMEACAEQGKPVLVLDRPNPNGHFIDGPILNKKFQSFIGRQEIPIVHGMTVAEYAQFLNGERLLKNGGVQADLKVVTCKNYTHQTRYELPIAPSPNLPNQQSILLYPSLCLFEGTNVSVGRGTTNQFQIYGSPEYALGSYAFTPESMPGAKYPKFENQQCFGSNLSTIPQDFFYEDAKINLSWLIGIHNYYQEKNLPFFLKNNFFNKLAGTDELRKQIEAGLSEEEIRMSWQDGLSAYKLKREKYLLYP